MNRKIGQVPAFKPGDCVKMFIADHQTDSGWRGVIIKRHPHRNNGYKVSTTTPAQNNRFSRVGDEFWVRPMNIDFAEEEIN